MTAISNTAQLNRRLRSVVLAALLGTGLLAGSFHRASAVETIPASQAQGSDPPPPAAASIGFGWG